ncbi:MAG: ATPase, BadF/BadG/BcrA/BcrD type, partial [Bryobacterales bacterium]|nr:ATPase, BadF/BadG/BcrA/BcrD type [Bryobacterales bacterium]
DEGGAFDIVRQALRAALRQEEGWGDATVLREAFLAETGQPNMNAVLHLFYTPDWPRNRVARFAVLVDGVATEGDSVAIQILENAGQQLGHLAHAVRRQLWPDDALVKAAYIGGAFDSAILLESFLTSTESHSFDVGAPILGPAAGALLEAYRLAGVSLDPRKLLPSNF